MRLYEGWELRDEWIVHIGKTWKVVGYTEKQVLLGDTWWYIDHLDMMDATLEDGSSLEVKND